MAAQTEPLCFVLFIFVKNELLAKKKEEDLKLAYKNKIVAVF